MQKIFEQSPQRYVRIGGALYLLIILLGLFGETISRGTIVFPGDAKATAEAIGASRMLWAGGIVGDLLMQLLDLPVIVVFYLLLKRVNAGLNLTATFTNLIQTAVLAANKLTLILPLLLLSGADYLAAVPSEQLHALAYLSINLHAYGFAVGLIFFGVACLLRGFLIYQSGYFPKILGLMQAFAGLCYLVNSLALILAPSFAAQLVPGIFLPILLGELALALWMLIKGINLQKWSGQAN
ncbi:DUF4386 domain-containing protein [Aliiglaciecola sp. CAU 1673]|uniref:DUF4386 domain-containing protein n=1 Tax=Aliiglaciecola sp. CAU 1673 TaxID=3032595 RepID=UPI0023DBCA32|nr:DUF4386 domain-containing protein [Aliiglaciecola sp. CAU 1673]MDF2180253.1 DUF4386 domain-containing protein [Aliiglaciecola sp. CAU 1673]